MTPEDTLSPSQEATKATRHLLAAQARCSDLSLEKQRFRAERDKALEEVEKLRAEKSQAVKKTEDAWQSIRSEAPEKAYGGTL